ncbi:MAG: hypothetical protein GEU91_00310 [Rhizobiales bacterium]|nr:hypothetical protein [Hyphomicrobiales bacterium]
MTYDPIDPNRIRDVNNPYGRAYDGPHWGWYAGLVALLILGMVAFIGSNSDSTRTAVNDGRLSTSAPATTGAAPETPSPINRNGVR